MRKMMRISLLLVPLIAACESPLETITTDAPSFARAGNPSANGGGHFAIGALDVKFAFAAVQRDAAGNAVGNARHSVVLGGELIEFRTKVTCMTVDADNGRAWIGGIITHNNSTHSDFIGAIHQPGRDIWFRVVDYGEGANASQADRSTFVGFEGSADIITSQEYCETMPWPDDDARTNPVTSGNLQVRG